jgi:hypothetical protein
MSSLLIIYLANDYIIYIIYNLKVWSKLLILYKKYNIYDMFFVKRMRSFDNLSISTIKLESGVKDSHSFYHLIVYFQIYNKNNLNNINGKRFR